MCEFKLDATVQLQQVVFRSKCADCFTLLYHKGYSGIEGFQLILAGGKKFLQSKFTVASCAYFMASQMM